MTEYHLVVLSVGKDTFWGRLYERAGKPRWLPRGVSPDTSSKEEFEVEIMINNIPPEHIPSLQPGSFWTLTLGESSDLQIKLCRDVWTKEDLESIREIARESAGLFIVSTT